MNRRLLACCAILLALLAPGPLLAAITVKSNSAQEFWLIRQDIMINLAPNNAARLRIIGGDNSPFGPHPIGGPTPAKTGATYVIFPACGPNRQLKPDRRRLVAAAANTIIYVECI